MIPPWLPAVAFASASGALAGWMGCTVFHWLAGLDPTRPTLALWAGVAAGCAAAWTVVAATRGDRS